VSFFFFFFSRSFSNVAQTEGTAQDVEMLMRLAEMMALDEAAASSSETHSQSASSSRIASFRTRAQSDTQAPQQRTRSLLGSRNSSPTRSGAPLAQSARAFVDADVRYDLLVWSCIVAHYREMAANWNLAGPKTFTLFFLNLIFVRHYLKLHYYYIMLILF
jgi:hypothetical protein